MKRTRAVNDIGVGFAGISTEHLRDILVFPGGSGVVQIEVVMCGMDGATYRSLQYLTPEEAMCFSRGFERCAIEALKEQGETP